MPRKKECSCEACQECCTREAGWFVPEEIKPAADFLGLSEDEFVEQYCQKHDLGHTFALSPKAKEDTTICVFFEKGLCKIHEVKPYECRKAFGCESDRRHTRMRELIIKQWK